MPASLFILLVMTPSGPLQNINSTSAPSIKPPNANWVSHISLHACSNGYVINSGMRLNSINKVIGKIDKAILALPMKSNPGPER